jgi:L-amino acid N-acyltransferase YncA
MRVVRAAALGDAPTIARIYSQGIEDRVATFETAPRSEADVRPWFDRTHPIVVVLDDDAVVAFAVAAPSSARQCYARNADFSVYVERLARGSGAGRAAMDALIDAARDAGLNKLVSCVFPENEASRTMLATLGFREVGTYQRHAQLDGVWRDAVLVEKLL